MATIIDYVAQETRDFSEYPFHVADALVYAILSYDKIPQEAPQLSSLLECFGSISSKLRNFNLKHPSRSLAALWRTPFPGPHAARGGGKTARIRAHPPLLGASFRLLRRR